jgi:ribosomal protein S18 acetylase RimI-like enzyme
MEIKSLAVLERYRGRGMGGALIRAATERAFSAGAAEVMVSTATADIGNLRFYQGLGFHMGAGRTGCFHRRPRLSFDGGRRQFDP